MTRIEAAAITAQEAAARAWTALQDARFVKASAETIAGLKADYKAAEAVQAATYAAWKEAR